MTRTIVAIGGGSLSEERDDKQIEDYILDVCGKENPRVCDIPTASGDNPAGILRFYETYTSERCRPSHLTLIDRKIADPSVISSWTGHHLYRRWQYCGDAGDLAPAWRRRDFGRGLGPGNRPLREQRRRYLLARSGSHRLVRVAGSAAERRAWVHPG